MTLQEQVRTKLHPAAFVLASVMGHTMLVNRYDYDPKEGFGVSAGLLLGEIPALPYLACRLATARRQTHGDGIVLIDGGANIGSFTIPVAKHMQNWGQVIAFEPQRWPYYALCGNIAINNVFNVEARQQALGKIDDEIAVPIHDPTKPHNAGGVSLLTADADNYEWCVSVDKLALPRLDILKLDIEGMEPQAIAGARQTIAQHKPIIIAEAHICGPQAIIDALPDYKCIGLGVDMLCIHKNEPNEQLHRDMLELSRLPQYTKAA